MTKTINEIIGEALGEASMCWSEIPKGVFDSNRATRIMKRTVALIEKNCIRRDNLGLDEEKILKIMLDTWRIASGQNKAERFKVVATALYDAGYRKEK